MGCMFGTHAMDVMVQDTLQMVGEWRRELFDWLSFILVTWEVNATKLNPI